MAHTPDSTQDRIRRKLDEVADRFNEWLDGLLPGPQPQPVPVPVPARDGRSGGGRRRTRR